MEALQKNLSPRLIINAIDQHKEANRFYHARLTNAFLQLVEKNKQRLMTSKRLLNSVSYTKILERGFALVLDDNKTPVKRANQLPENGQIKIKFADDIVDATTAHQGTRQTKKNKRQPPDTGQQGDLF